MPRALRAPRHSGLSLAARRRAWEIDEPSPSRCTAPIRRGCSWRAVPPAPTWRPCARSRRTPRCSSPDSSRPTPRSPRRSASTALRPLLRRSAGRAAPIQPQGYIRPGAPPFLIAHGTDLVGGTDRAEHWVDGQRGCGCACHDASQGWAPHGRGAAPSTPRDAPGGGRQPSCCARHLHVVQAASTAPPSARTVGGTRSCSVGGAKCPLTRSGTPPRRAGRGAVLAAARGEKAGRRANRPRGQGPGCRGSPCGRRPRPQEDACSFVGRRPARRQAADDGSTPRGQDAE
ncbi:hypothetical protein QF037_009672 [Streptomyces canus]|nr:hypothetical protein [Streptomyces canus]